MGNGDNRYGGDRFGGNDRWQTPDRNDQWAAGGGGRQDREGGNWGGGGSHGGRSHDDDRGFFERAGEQVRSWFNDDDDRSGGRGQSYGGGRMSGGQDRDHNRGSESFGGGFGNQRGWGDTHFDRGQSSGAFGGGREQGGREQGHGGGGFFGGGDRDRSSEQDRGFAGGSNRSSWGGGGGGADTWGGSGFGGPDDNGRRFDRIDPGHVGAQGAHPMSSPVDAGYGAGAGSYSRSAAIMSQSGGGHGGGIDPQARDRMLGRSGGGQSPSRGQSHGGGFGGSHHDPHYSEWRQRQIHELDRDYDEYRREHQSKFEQEFGGWRQKRQGQRQSLGRVSPQMEVVGSDGQHIGTVDKVRGDRVILTKSDPNADGIHHSIPCSWIENVDEKVTVNKSAEEAMRAWRDEEQNKALFEGDRSSQGGEGPHMLNRSFSGTYKDDEK
jgi:hypothetical protein